MIPALVALISVPGLALTWALLRQRPLARDVVAPGDDPDVLSFGFDAHGLID